MSSSMGKHQIVANPASLVDGDSIASYLVSAAGSLITSETIGSNEHAHVKNPSEYVDGTAYSAAADYLQAIAVVDNAGNYVPFTLNAAGELPVSATVDFAGDYAEDSAHVSGDVGLFSLAVRRDTRDSGVDSDGDYASFNINAVGELWVKDADVLAELVDQGTTLDSTLTELLEQGTVLDNIYTEQLAQGVTLDSILADTATIDSQTLSIQNTLTALSKAEDAAHSSGDQGIQALAVRKDTSGSNAANGDYTSLLTWSEGSLKVVDTANGSILQQQISVTDTATALPASALANRKSLMIQNTGANKLWVGSGTVTTSGATAGIEFPPNSFMEMDVGPAVTVYAIKNGATGNNVNILEMAG